jgi:hypothetical protein
VRQGLLLTGMVRSTSNNRPKSPAKAEPKQNTQSHRRGSWSPHFPSPTCQNSITCPNPGAAGTSDQESPTNQRQGATQLFSASGNKRRNPTKQQPTKSYKAHRCVTEDYTKNNLRGSSGPHNPEQTSGGHTHAGEETSLSSDGPSYPSKSSSQRVHQRRKRSYWGGSSDNMRRGSQHLGMATVWVPIVILTV